MMTVNVIEIILMSRYILLIIFIFVSNSVKSDQSYYIKLLLKLEINNYQIKHYSEWGSGTSSYNKAYIEILKSNDRREAVKINTPPLTYLWVSDNEKYIVGFSTIKVNNPYQIIVINIEKEEIIFKQKMKCDYIYPNVNYCFQSITNIIGWYFIGDPQIQLEFFNKKLTAISFKSLECNKSYHHRKCENETTRFLIKINNELIIENTLIKYKKNGIGVHTRYLDWDS